MPLFGAHVPIAGGLHKAAESAAGLGMETMQLFTANPNAWHVTQRQANQAANQLEAALTNRVTWEGKPLNEEVIRTFRRAVADARLRFPTAHDSYLINLASPDPELYQRSIEAFSHELERAEALGLSYLVTHPGAHTGTGEQAGIVRVIAALDQVHERSRGFRVKVLLETTAGQGTTLGYRFEQLAAMLEGVEDSSWLGVCLDTCHVFAAGYPLSTADEYATTFGQFDDLIGIERLELFHVNDSAKPFGSRVDRHASLGQGEIGLAAFRQLVTDPRFHARPMILETPKEDQAGTPMDSVNLGILRGFLNRNVVARAG